MAKSPKKKKKKSAKLTGKRKERRFSTEPNFMPKWVAIVGFVGCLVLGVGVAGYWVIEPRIEWASYAVALGGLGLGVALWFGQPEESAVSVGDSGIAVETGSETFRVSWFQMRALRITGGAMVAEGASHEAKFLLGANPHAAALALSQAAERVPDIVDVQKEATEQLPDVGQVKGYERAVEDDQVAGTRCAASKKLINLEEDARLCPNCGQVFHKDGVPESCPSCETELKGRTLLA